MTSGDPSPTQRPVRGCQTFEGRRFSTHVAAFAGGVVLWIAVYAAVVAGSGASHLVADGSARGLSLRQAATGVAGAGTGLYFAGAYARALGAPLPDLLAASAVSALMPARVLALGEAPPSPALVGGDLLGPLLALSAGSAVTVVAVVGWYRVRFGGTGTDGARRWEDEQFPPGFRLAVSATESGAIDWERAEYGLSEWGYWRFVRNGAVVLAGGLVLHGVVFLGRASLGDPLVLRALAETPWVLIALAGVAYVWWVNYRWRTSR